MKTIQVETYTTPDGRPTCGVDAMNNKFCMFYRVRNFGTQGVCAVTSEDVFYYEDGIGYQKPCKGCIVNQ